MGEMKIPKRTLKGPQGPSIPDLVEKCIACLAQDDLHGARLHCQQILAIEPKSLLGRLLAARVEYRAGHSDAAKQMLVGLSQEFPHHIEVWNDLSIVLVGRGDQQEARRLLENTLPATGHAPQIAERYVEILLALDESQNAIDYLRSQPRLFQVNDSLRLLLADALRVQKKYRESADLIEQALQGSPRNETLFRRLTALWREAKEFMLMEQTLRRWLGVAPTNPIALHLLDSLGSFSSESIASRASDEYVRTVFDEFAANFEQSLAQLDYQAPQQVESVLQTLIQRGQLRPAGLQTLDAGCGTGLCGPLLRPLSDSLLGVDLSPKMLEQAKARNLYDELIEAELTHYLRKNAQDSAVNQRFDLIVLCDTLNYFGDLEEVLQYSYQSLEPSGIVVFTIEKLPASSTGNSSTNCVLATHGRYLHNPVHIEQLMFKIGYGEVSLRDCELRKQAGEVVVGTLVWGQRTDR
jgi:predicted TPR repeat methyltransferase